MSYEDNQTLVTIRRLLVSCWVDTTAISIRVTNGNVYLSGTLQRMTQDHREMLPGQLKRLDLSIRSLRAAITTAGPTDSRFQLAVSR